MIEQFLWSLCQEVEMMTYLIHCVYKSRNCHSLGVDRSLGIGVVAIH